MKNSISRREMIRSFSGITIGVGIAGFPFNSSMVYGTTKDVRSQISVKVSPPGPKSLELLENVRKYIGRTNYAGLYGIGLKEGNGVYIEDLDGNTYIDCLTSASSNILGYSHDEIAKAYYDSSLKIQQTAFIYSPNVAAVEFAKKIAEITPGTFQKKVLMGMSGSDSMDGAIEAARKFTGKKGTISFNFAYHGSTGLSQSASDFRTLNEGIYDMNDKDFVKVAFPVTPEDGERTLRNIESILAFDKTAAVMYAT